MKSQKANIVWWFIGGLALFSLAELAWIVSLNDRQGAYEERVKESVVKELEYKRQVEESVKRQLQARKQEQAFFAQLENQKSLQDSFAQLLSDYESQHAESIKQQFEEYKLQVETLMNEKLAEYADKQAKYESRIEQDKKQNSEFIAGKFDDYKKQLNEYIPAQLENYKKELESSLRRQQEEYRKKQEVLMKQEFEIYKRQFRNQTQYQQAIQ